MVVFAVGGTINLHSPIIIKSPFITIAGQTAPGDGICIKTDGDFTEQSTLHLVTHDIIIRFLRVRPGTAKGDTWLSPIGIWSSEAHDIMIDHVSTSWGPKGEITIWNGPYNITIQNCIVSEGLKVNGHKGILVGGGSDRVTLYRNLFAHNTSRNPYIKATDGEVAKDADSYAMFQVVNNVIYNWSFQGMSIGADYSNHWAPFPGFTYANIISNYFKPGPNTDSRRRPIQVGGIKVLVYLDGNFFSDSTQNNWDMVDLLWKNLDIEAEHGTPAPLEFQSKVAFACPAIDIISAEKTYQQVLNNAGCIFPIRDAVDLRIVKDVKNGTGKIIDDPMEVGNWPILKTGVPMKDSDKDGMPDEWEIKQGLNPDVSVDANVIKRGSNGFTNLERYINALPLVK